MRIKIILLFCVFALIVVAVFFLYSPKKEAGIENLTAISQINAGHGVSVDSKKANNTLSINYLEVNLLKRIAQEKQPDQKKLENLLKGLKAKWDLKMFHFITGDLKFNQGVYEKYKEIQKDFFENENLLLKAPIQDHAYEKRLAEFSNNVREILAGDSSFDVHREMASPNKNLNQLYSAMAKALDQEKNSFLKGHLEELERLFGPNGFRKYQKMKTEFNLKVTNNAGKDLIKL